MLLLDVRGPQEREIGHLPGKVIPFGDLSQCVYKLEFSGEIAASREVGARSARTVERLKCIGSPRVNALEDGINAWAERVDRTLPRY